MVSSLLSFLALSTTFLTFSRALSVRPVDDDDLSALLEASEGFVAPQAASPARSSHRLALRPRERVLAAQPVNAKVESLVDVNSPPSGPDPFDYVGDDLLSLADQVREVVDTDHPVLKMAASHFFSLKSGKKFRPTIVMLISRAAAAAANSGADVGDSVSYKDVDDMPSADVYDKQRRLGQITEMIHTASLIHDDVLDDAETRRGGDSVHKLYSNKVAVLAGDFLLARASVLLAQLGNVEVVETMANALDSLVTGEVMQAKAEPDDLTTFDWYMKKTYMKTASLIACSTRSAALLGGFASTSEETVAAEKYGYHLGLAFQIVDDLLDFTQSADLLGKPACSDLNNGQATAPILFAAEEYPELNAMIRRKFKQPGDVDRARKLLERSKGLERTKSLARWHAQQAVEWLSVLPDSPARRALVKLGNRVIVRTS
ncbi:unnamed protein product [Vitrella brassicaformis CCMP3155]|uniref:Uncharacterized protein n=2 Tax=Vitrella brassicaformis TaxID=1169539 RepID=A0A0G4ENY0_VITBC|nr:unnamed protein product [Vitrella brassicaformis CCMP3155]|mmetsp:Transcript_6076/g.14603  ORF Transcript_6076/g.14603 Transcript_6076/m.14603 type:complete len:431 (+) Transcript_6076:84-1376(+)|eukprot:CEL99505.1 unnamed protein product [Vitrella brassicaformis CCMP3155]